MYAIAPVRTIITKIVPGATLMTKRDVTPGDPPWVRAVKHAGLAPEHPDPKATPGYRTYPPDKTDLQTGPHRMQYAILLDAARAYQKRPTHLPFGVARTVQQQQDNARIRDDAANGREVLIWLHSSEQDYPFSFLAICDELGLDPDVTRHAVKTGNFWRRVVPSISNDRKRRIIGKRYRRASVPSTTTVLRHQTDERKK